ncbi:MAG: hypothetical protein Ta2B_09710 [Termitinemataceae bacterium]|nr:MAG: hypothetical protein Ta2B_09710 [Termitinemataceae bacterium]
MFCIKCGNELSVGSKFCPKCGEKITHDLIDHQPTETIEQDEPENILLKAMVTAEREYPSYAMNNGNLIITNKRVVYKSSRFLNVDLLGSADSDLSIYYNEIAELKNTTYNLVFPAIRITTKDGYKIKFGGFGKIKRAYEIICEKCKTKKLHITHVFCFAAVAARCYKMLGQSGCALTPTHFSAHIFVARNTMCFFNSATKMSRNLSRYV